MRTYNQTNPTNGNLSSVDLSFSCCAGNFPLYIAHDVQTTSALDDNPIYIKPPKREYTASNPGDE
jgi:hypothetical protein